MSHWKKNYQVVRAVVDVVQVTTVVDEVVLVVVPVRSVKVVNQERPSPAGSSFF